MNYEEIIQEIVNRLKAGLPRVWDGKTSISYMKDNGCHNWKQMEWPGFYFQFMCEKILGENGFMTIPGPKYGNVEFDGLKEIPWDFKAHSFDASKRDNGKVPTNGYNETLTAINEYGEVCFIIARGESEYDSDGTFKAWHDELKGGISSYEVARIARNARSRRRKTSFALCEIVFVFVSKDTINTCGKFQNAFRNSNGVARNPKVMIDMSNPKLVIKRFNLND